MPNKKTKNNLIDDELNAVIASGKKTQIRDRSNYFFIHNDSADLKRDITAIAKNKGITVTRLVKSLLIKLRDDTPAHMKIWKKD